MATAKIATITRGQRLGGEDVEARRWVVITVVVGFDCSRVSQHDRISVRSVQGETSCGGFSPVAVGEFHSPTVRTPVLFGLQRLGDCGGVGASTGRSEMGAVEDKILAVVLGRRRPVS